MRGTFIKDAPKVTADNFVDHLTSDDTLVNFFNDFLSLPSFPHAVTYNLQTGVFEEVSDAVECLSRTIRSALNHCRSRLFSDPSWITATPLLDNRYSVLYLDQKQGLQWILKERLPFFIRSDCYFEYRLAKLLSLRDPRCQGPGVRYSAQSPPTQEEKKEEKDPPIQGPTVYLTEAATTECCCRNCKSHNPLRGPLEHLAASLVAEVLRDVETEMDGYPTLSKARTDTTHECCIQSEQRGVASRCGMGVSSEMERSVKLEGGVRGSNKEHNLDAGFHGASIHGASIYGSRQGIEEFKAFLRGTPGEKMLGLWMDIERLKTMEGDDTKHRHLIQMRQNYLLSSTGEARLSAELLSRLGLATSPCWREDKLDLIQPCITQALLLYWGPRFLSSQSGCGDGQEGDLSLREKKQLHPPWGHNPSPHCVTLHPLRPNTCIPSADPEPGALSSSPSLVLEGQRMERMLTALYVDPQAGYFFTGFCERSGNQLWNNAALCWWDLQEYHTLFCQDGLDPYRVKRLAQMLHSTYVCSAAQRGVGLGEEIRRRVYQCLSPPFEELFDGVEEHVLTLLLEPWALLQSRDTHVYQRVCVWEETRQVDLEQYRELRSLYEEAERQRLLQVQLQATSALPPPEGPKAPDSWDKVPERYRRYRLGSLLRQRTELHHFLAFLEEHSASIHLTCWLDVDKLRRTPQKDKVTREERSKDVKTKYLNRKYLFGPGSPASAEQQEDLLRLAGGWSHLQQDCISNAFLVEVQSIIRAYLEREWLPLFLATPQFSQRQTLKRQGGDSDSSDKVYQRHRKKTEVWKAEGSRMSSSHEVLALRRALLHPATCLQFQTFVSLQGHFLENDVLFWLEVQRYKDLCHSHCDEAVVQNKVSTIISCFLNSSVPPAVQVDVPPEQVQNILERRAELGPYIFREAQMSVFSELLRLWPQFQAFRSSVEEDDMLPLLEKRRRKHRERLLRQRRREEEEQEEEKEEEETLSEEEEQEDRLTGRCSREHPYPSQQITWSYSMYIMALEKEELLLKRHTHLEQGGASTSTVSDSLSCPSVRSGGSRPRRSVLSPRPDSAPLTSMD